GSSPTTSATTSTAASHGFSQPRCRPLAVRGCGSACADACTEGASRCAAGSVHTSLDQVSGARRGPNAGEVRGGGKGDMAVCGSAAWYAGPLAMIPHDGIAAPQNRSRDVANPTWPTQWMWPLASRNRTLVCAEDVEP